MERMDLHEEMLSDIEDELNGAEREIKNSRGDDRWHAREYKSEMQEIHKLFYRYHESTYDLMFNLIKQFQEQTPGCNIDSGKVEAYRVVMQLINSKLERGLATRGPIIGIYPMFVNLLKQMYWHSSNDDLVSFLKGLSNR